MKNSRMVRWESLTKAQEQERKAAVVKDWRRRNPEATCSDFVALTLAEMEALVGRA